MRSLKLSLFICCFVLSGCGVPDYYSEETVNYLKREKPSYDAQLFDSYRQIEINKSTSADVLAMIHRADCELLSQSKSVIASTGQQKEGYKTWFEMAAFNENELTVNRKYFFEIDERPKILFKQQWGGLRFDCDVILPAKILSEPYANENARRIAVLKQIQENFRTDIADVHKDYKALMISGLLVNQTLGASLNVLDKSPALATRLNEPAGVEFSHLNLDNGKIQMVIVDNIARVKIRLGSFLKMKLPGDEIYKCPKCGYIYDPFLGDPEHGIKPGTGMEVLPENWVCSRCAGIMKKQ